jgi:cytochrome c oxidase subunit 1
MWRGQLTFETPMLFAIGFLVTFLLGGLSGVLLASPPVDFFVHDTYFVVAHFHNTLIGGSVFAIFAAMYYWFPKMTGRRLSERLGRLQFVLWLVGFTLTFLPQYELGLEGMPRRIADYAAATGWSNLNLLSTIGSAIMGIGILPFLLAVAGALRRPRDQPADPWGGSTLEWWTDSPPPPGNFRTLPPIRSARPVFDARLAASEKAPP